MNLVLQTFNETIEFLPGYEVKDHDNLTPFSDKAAALVFLHRVAAYLHDMSALRTLLAKEGNGINVSQLNDSQMLEVLADRLRYGRIKVRRTPKLGSPSATGMSSEQQYMTPREVEQLEKKRRGERRSISNATSVTEVILKEEEKDDITNSVTGPSPAKLEMTPAEPPPAEPLSPKTVISSDMEKKILFGKRVINSDGKITNGVRGGHSPTINNTNPDYAVEVLRTNPDNTRVVKFTTQFSDGNLAKIKQSTLFPDSWSESDIMAAICQIGDTDPLVMRIKDKASLHRGVVNGVEIEVIKIGNNVTSAYPTGGKPTTLTSF